MDRPRRDMPNPVRVLMEERARKPPAGPPCTVSGVDIIYMRFAVEREAAQRLLPPGYLLDRRATGCIGLYTSTDAQGVAPHTACFFALGLDNYETPDRDVGLFIVGDLRSEPAGSMFRTHYCGVSVPGWATIERHGTRVVGEAGTAGGPWLVRIEAEMTKPTGTLFFATEYYFANRAGGDGQNFYSTTGRHIYADLKHVTVTISDVAPEWMQALRPSIVTMPMMAENADLLFSIPQMRDLGAETVRREDLMALFSALGRPALMIDPNGRVAHVNREAAQLAPDLRDVAQRSEIADAISAVLATQQPAPPVHLIRPGDEPLLAQALPLTPALVGDHAVLLLFSDPGRPRLADPAPALRLLGLTQSEARLAAAVGGGKPPKVAATSLGISEGNARTTLKAVFRKLGLARQAELVRLIGRLERA